MQTRLKLDGMTCAACVAHVEKALEAVPGVETVHVSLQTQSADVEHNEANREKLIAAVNAAGYQAELADSRG